ncbi:hypothetical protein AVDCRST_MAG92-2905, partial [uncultured Coleofasciculus sp.]
GFYRAVILPTFARYSLCPRTLCQTTAAITLGQVCGHRYCQESV